MTKIHITTGTRILRDRYYAEEPLNLKLISRRAQA